MRLSSRTRYYQSHFAIRLIGWILLCSGIYVILDAIAVNEWVLMLLGHVFALAGAAIAFGGSKIEFDIDTKRITKRHGLFRGFKIEKYELEAIRAVQIAKSYHRTDNRNFVVYAVTLQGSSTPIYIGEYFDYEKARRQAEHIAKMLHTDVRDASSGKTRKRLHATIDQPLQMQLLRAKNLMRKPNINSAGRWQVNDSPEQTVLTLSPQKFSPRNGIAFVIATLLAWLVCIFVFPVLNAVSPWFSLAISLIFGLVTVLPDVAVVEEILLTPVHIDHRRRLFGFVLTRRISVGDIEEMIAGNNGTIVLRGDNKSVSFGSGMNAEEKRWAAEFIRYWIAHRAGLVA